MTHFLLALSMLISAKDYKANTVPPTIVTEFKDGGAYVVGLDGKIRTCLPIEYSLLVRIERTKGQDLNFYYAVPGVRLFPDKDTHYTVLCVLVKP